MTTALQAFSPVAIGAEYSLRMRQNLWFIETLKAKKMQPKRLRFV